VRTISKLSEQLLPFQDELLLSGAVRSVAKFFFREVLRAVRISSEKLRWPNKVGGRQEYSGNLWPLDLLLRAITCDAIREVP